jgi:AraC-like DNA-binding protein
MTQSIYKAILYIDENIKRDIDLQQVADHVGYSLSYLHNVFFKVMGQSLACYIRKKKMKLAAERLVFGMDNILDIALGAGYSSHEAFTRAFKEEYNVTPKSFRANPLNRELFMRMGRDRSEHSIKNENTLHTKGGNVIMKTSGGMKNLEGVRQVGFYNGSGWCPEDIPFTSCMSAVMEHLGEYYPVKQLGAHGQEWNQHMGNVYFLGWSGMAFGLLWKMGWHQEVGDLMMADDPQELVRRTFQAAGRGYHVVSGKNGGDFTSEIIKSIDNGVPVLAFGVIGPPECCIITGYADGGDSVIGWNFFQDMDVFDKTGTITLPSGQFMRSGWQEHTLSLIIIDDKTDKPDIKLLDRNSLKNAVKIAETPEVNGYISGHAAYDAWAKQVLSDEGITQVMSDTLRANFDVHNMTVGNIAEARAWAARYIWDMMEERYPDGEAAKLLDAAACCYDDIHSLMWDAWNVLGGNGNPDAYIKFADNENRKKISDIIKKAHKKDMQAVENIKKALEVL